MSKIVTLLSRLLALTLGANVKDPLKAFPAFPRITLLPLTPVIVTKPVPVVIVVDAACVMSPPAVIDKVPVPAVAMLIVPKFRAVLSTTVTALFPVLVRLTAPIKLLA